MLIFLDRAIFFFSVQTVNHLSHHIEKEGVNLKIA